LKHWVAARVWRKRGMRKGGDVRFDGVAFDLDGTLYPNYRFYCRVIPFALLEWRLLLAFNSARKVLHAENHPSHAAFYDLQAELMADNLNQDQRFIKEKTERLIYRGWEPLFKRIALYPFVHETLSAFRDAGLKLGILSDFPLPNKLRNLKLDGLWDAALCSEEIGHLKPSPVPFLELEKQLGVPASRLLYVGNSARYDVRGAKNAGMKAALISPWLKPKQSAADFVFTDYRALREYVLLP
jgi:putative hydrolase of the HAD superfamily